MSLDRSNTEITLVIAVCNVQSGLKTLKRLYNIAWMKTSHMEWGSGTFISMALTWGGRGGFLPFPLWGMGVRLWYVIASGQAWGSRERGQQCSVRRCLQTIRDQTWVTRPLRSEQPANCERSPSPCACSPAGLAVQVAVELSVLDGSSLTEA